MKKHTPIKIATDKISEARHKANLSALKTHLSDFFSEASKFIKIENKTLYEQNLFNTFLSEFNTQLKHEFPPMLSLEKCMELAEVNTNKLKFLSDKITELNKDIKLNFDTLEAPEKDFGIYTQNETQNQLYKMLVRLVGIINECKNYQNPIYSGDLLRGFGGMLIFDHSTQQLQPNISWLLSK